MGLFSKIKQNINHGGIKVDLQAPASTSMQDANVPVTISVTNTNDQQQTINRITAEIIATSQNQSFNDPNNTTNNVINKVVARSDYSQPFVVMPGEIGGALNLGL